jgi:hypothetical protein
MFCELKALDLHSCTAVVGTINSLYSPQSVPLCPKYKRRKGPWKRQRPLTPDSKLSSAANINIQFTLTAYIYEILQLLKCVQFLSGQIIDCFYGSRIVTTRFTHPVTRQYVEQVTASLHTHTPNPSDQAYASF